MLTKIIVKNFKSFSYAEIELGQAVVFVGPNNSGKTTALQALALWDTGLKRWLEKRGLESKTKKRPGVAINRRELITLPLPSAKLIWHNLHTREMTKETGKLQPINIRVEITVEGVTEGKQWSCGLEFDYNNEESFYCRPLRQLDDEGERSPIPFEVESLQVAFLPPMSGLSANETLLDPGAINVRLGEGRTAEVLRNLCYRVFNKEPEVWKSILNKVDALFGVKLDEPVYNSHRGEIAMTYRNHSGACLDLSATGRGLQQTLLLLTHLSLNPNSVLLLDEPDAHLEILRQREIYQVLTEWAHNNHSQIIAASHSEVVLNEAADRDVVIAFVGKPHRIDDRGSQVLKALKEIGFDQYYQAELVGFVLYLEGSTDLAILRAFARKLTHPALEILERPFVHYVYNNPPSAKHHFYGLREAKKDLVGFALFDSINNELIDDKGLKMYQWKRREIENYLCQKETLLAWAMSAAHDYSPGPLFIDAQTKEWRTTMEHSLNEVEEALSTLSKAFTPESKDLKASDDYLEPIFKKFFSKLGLPNLMNKSNYHQLAQYIPDSLIDSEVSAVLDKIIAVANTASPTTK